MTNTIFSYTKRDYEQSRKEGLSKIPVLSGGAWTDLNASDPGIIMLDYVHALVDMINYYQDHQALETFISTAKERVNIFRLAKQLSYKVRSAKGAKVSVKFGSYFAYEHVVKIPKYTRVYTADDTQYYTTEDAYLGIGESEVSVICEQGTIATQIYNGTGLSRLSNVEPPLNVNQSITLSEKYIDTDSISIVDNLGREWKPVDFIAFATEIDRVYQVDLNPDDSVTIKFGDGRRGVVPSETDVLTVKYAITRADAGRVGPHSIIRSEYVYDDYGKYIDFYVTNESESTGGYAPQTSREIRELAPGVIKSSDRAITLSDFENLAKMNSGIYDAIAYDINVDSEMPYHEVKVLVIPKESDNGSNQIILDEIYNYLYQRMIPPTTLRVVLPTEILIDVEIHAKSIDSQKEHARYEIEKSVQEYFNKLSYIIGEKFYPTDLAAVIKNVPNINYVTSVSAKPLDTSVYVSTIDQSITIPKLSRAKLNTLAVYVD